MSDPPTNDGFDGDDNLGEPIAALAAIELQPSVGFLTRVRRKIYRRTTTSQLMSFTWHMPQMLLLEFLKLIGDLLNPQGKQREP